MTESGGNLSTLDFMRGLCTVVVVVIHYLGMTGRFPQNMAHLPRVVVLMFFVHTGFVLMLSLERQYVRSPDKLWRAFMVRRMFRVYPLTTCVLAIILLFEIPSRLVPPHFRFVLLGAGGILSNFLLTMNLTESEPLLSPMWSLPYEFQLYCSLPVLFLLVRHRRAMLPVLGLWFLTLALAIGQPLIPHGARLDILQFAPCLVAGILCYQLSKTVSPTLPFGLWAVLLPLFMSGCLLPRINPWHAAWIACFLSAVVAPFVKQTHSGVLRGVSGWVAQRSYSIYLTHYFCLWLAFRANHWHGLPQWSIFMVTIVLLPIGLYRLIEMPMIRLGRRLSRVGSAAPRAFAQLEQTMAGRVTRG